MKTMVIKSTSTQAFILIIIIDLLNWPSLRHEPQGSIGCQSPEFVKLLAS